MKKMARLTSTIQKVIGGKSARPVASNSILILVHTEADIAELTEREVPL